MSGSCRLVGSIAEHVHRISMRDAVPTCMIPCTHASPACLLHMFASKGVTRQVRLPRVLGAFKTGWLLWSARRSPTM